MADQLPEHRSLLVSIMGRFGLGDALEKKLDASDRRIERVRRRGAHSAANLAGEDDTGSSDAGGGDGVVAQQAPLTPSHLRALYQDTHSSRRYQQQPSTSVAARRRASPPLSCRRTLMDASGSSSGSTVHRQEAMASRGRDEGSGQGGVYRRLCFAHPAATTTTTGVDVDGGEALFHGELLPRFLIRLQKQVSDADAVPPDYALVRRKGYDAHRQRQVMDAIAAGDAILRRLTAGAAHEGAAEADTASLGGSEAQRKHRDADRLRPSSSPVSGTPQRHNNASGGGVAAVLSVPRPLHPTPLRCATPRVVYDSIDAFTETEAHEARAAQVAARSASKSYKNRVAMDDVVGAISDLQRDDPHTNTLSPVAVRPSSPTVDALLAQLSSTASSTASPQHSGTDRRHAGPSAADAKRTTATPRPGASERAACRLYDESISDLSNTATRRRLLSSKSVGRRLDAPRQAQHRAGTARRHPPLPSPLVVAGSFDPMSMP